MKNLSRLPVYLAITFTILWPATTARSQATESTAPRASISGHVLVNGKAGADIDVAAFNMDNPGNRRIPAARTKTDSEGYYHLSGLTAGNYQVTTFTPNLTPTENSNTEYGYMYLGTSKGVLLSAGEDVGDVDVKLVRGGVITGRVTETDGTPLVEERISLEVVPEAGNPRMAPNPMPGSQMYQTDDRGVYRIYGLRAGRYRVSVGRSLASGYVGFSNTVPLTYHPDVTDAARAEIVELLESSEATNIDIKVRRTEQDTFSISGRVVDSETGVPVSGARIGLTFTRNEQRGFSTISSGNTSDAAGRFNVFGVTPGQYGIYISSDYGENEFYSDPTNVEVVDKNVSGVEIKAVHGLSISGTIAAENIELREALKDLPGLRISANVVPPDGRVSPSTIRSFGSGTVRPDGSFVITGLRPGRAQISIMSSDNSKRPSIARVMVGGVGVTQGFEIQPGQSVSGIQLLIAYGTGVIRGAITIIGGSLPDGLRATVLCRREGSTSYSGSASGDSRGKFMMRGLAPGTYQCSLQYMPYGPVAPFRPPPPQNQIVNVANGVEAELNFVIDLTPKQVGP